MSTKKGTSRVPLVFTCITLIIGFMIAILFQTNSDPLDFDLRDMNELRGTLQAERDRAQFLMSEISKYDQLLYQYETSMNKEDRVIEIMEREINRIRRLTGFEEVIGDGFIIRIEEADEGQLEEEMFEPIIYDEDFQMIINELNAHGAKAISINGQRVIASTAIRNVGDRILINTFPIQAPFEIRVIGDESILIPALKLAGLEQYFSVVNHSITYEPQSRLRINAYAYDQQNPYHLFPIKEDQ